MDELHKIAEGQRKDSAEIAISLYHQMLISQNKYSRMFRELFEKQLLAVFKFMDERYPKRATKLKWMYSMGGFGWGSIGKFTCYKGPDEWRPSYSVYVNPPDDNKVAMALKPLWELENMVLKACELGVDIHLMKPEYNYEWYMDTVGTIRMLLGDLLIRGDKRTNVRGSRVYSCHVGSVDRYKYDTATDAVYDQWEQYDTEQDAHYFGIWVSKKLLSILTYAEGDVNYVKCETAEQFNAEIENMNKYYGEGFIAKSIGMDGSCETLRQNRNDFLVVL